MALAAAYATVDKSFKEYRNRTIEKYGKEVDEELRYGIKTETINVEETDEETGEIKTVEKEIKTADISEYSKFFDQTCPNWAKNSQANQMFIRGQERYATQLLKTRGYLFLNDVYVALGIAPTKAGQVVGWIYCEKDTHMGDNCCYYCSQH